MNGLQRQSSLACIMGQVCRQLRPIHLRSRSFETAFIWDHNIFETVATSPLVLNVQFITNGMCAKNNTICVEQTSNKWSDLVRWTLLLFAATVRSCAHMPLEFSDGNKVEPATSMNIWHGPHQNFCYLVSIQHRVKTKLPWWAGILIVH